MKIDRPLELRSNTERLSDQKTEEMKATAERTMHKARSESLPGEPQEGHPRLEGLDAEEILSLLETDCPPPFFFDVQSRRVYTAGGLPLCGPVAVLGRFRDLDGHGWSRLLGFVDLDGRPQFLLVPNKQIDGGGRGALVAKLADRGLWLSDRGDDIATLIKGWETRRRGLLVDQPGWLTSDGVWRGYVLPCGSTISRPGHTDPILMRGAGVGMQPKTSGTLEGWQETVGRLALDNPVVMFAISVALAGPLLAFSRLTTVGFNLFGSTTVGKTTSLRAGLSVLPDYPKEPPRWTGTNTGVELRAARQTDSLLALDEYPTAPRPDAVTMAMALGNGTGWARGTGQLTLREQTQWRCAILSTAEFPIRDILERAGRTPPEGLSVRLIDVPVERTYGAFDTLHGRTAHEFARDILHKAQEHNGHVALGFVEYLLTRADTLSDKISAWQTGYERELKRHLGLEAHCPGTAERVLGAFALVAISGELAIQAGLLPWPKGAARTAVATMASAWWRHQTRPKVLIDLLEEIEDVGTMLPPLDSGAAGGDHEKALGWADDGTLYLPRTTVEQIEPGAGAQMGKQQKLRLLEQAGILLRGTERGCLQDRITIPGTRRRCRVYRLDREAIRRVLDADGEP